MIYGNVIGNGDIAKALREQSIPYAGVTYIASGLSNSSNVTYYDLIREQELIYSYKEDHCVYFSSLSIYYNPHSTYSHYKKEVEEYVKTRCKSWTIVRLGNTTFGNNPNTLLNYLRSNPEAERRNVIRYLIDKEEFLHWMKQIRVGVNDIMNLTGRMVNVKDLDIK